MWTCCEAADSGEIWETGERGESGVKQGKMKER